MIDCTECYLDSLHESNDERVRCSHRQICERAYEQGRADTIEEFRQYLKTVIPCEMPQDMWDLGVDNTCDRMLKEKKDDK